MDASLIGGNGIRNAWLLNFFMNCILVIALPIGGILGDYIGQMLGNEEKGKCQERDILSIKEMTYLKLSVSKRYQLFVIENLKYLRFVICNSALE